MVEVKITEISVSNLGFAVFLRPVEEEQFKKILPIFIGRLELHAIQSVLEGIIPPRPMTHDLVVNVLNEMKIRVERVKIVDIRDNTFYGEIEFRPENGEDVVVMDARPSDCMALAVRLKAPVFVAESVLEQAGVEVEESAGEEAGVRVPESGEGDASEFKSEEEVLRQRLEVAVQAENFEEAAIIRDQLKSLTSEN